MLQLYHCPKQMLLRSLVVEPPHFRMFLNTPVARYPYSYLLFQASNPNQQNKAWLHFFQCRRLARRSHKNHPMHSIADEQVIRENQADKFLLLKNFHHLL